MRAGQRAWCHERRSGDRIVGWLSGVIDGAGFASGHSAPWGGPDLARERESPAEIGALVDGALDALREEGVEHVRVRARPAHLSPSEPEVQHALLARGFVVEACELSLHLDLAGMRDGEDYLATLRSPARRAARHLRATALTLEEAAGDAGFAAGHAVLAANRAAKGRPMRLSLAYLIAAREAFGGRVKMLLLRGPGGGPPCAAALVYTVLPGRELVVSWGDHGHDLARSPMNLLALRLVERALADGVRTIDLGVSSVAGVADEGLVQFKRSIGARSELRLDLVRDLRAPEKRTGGHLPASNRPRRLSNTSRDDDRASAGAPAQAMRAIAASLGFRTASAHQSSIFSRALRAPQKGLADTCRLQIAPGNEQHIAACSGRRGRFARFSHGICPPVVCFARALT